MGAAGRDFHDFNMAFRRREDCEVVAFTATQIPNIDDRRYPPSLAGPLYPDGIPILPEHELPALIHDLDVDEVIFAYSDVTHERVMHVASLVLAEGADFRLMGPKATEVKAAVPVVSICATRTGSGKSQTTRRVAALLREHGLAVAVIRHPMPYGDLAAQAVQRFATLADLDLQKTTIEEREEYEPHIVAGNIVFAGVDYEAITRAAEAEAEVILWDGGNNDAAFLSSDLEIVVVDPLRAGHEVRYHPGEQNLRMADVIVVNKIDSATPAQIEEVLGNIAQANPRADVIMAESPVTIEDSAALRGKKVLIVEDGPTVTHGEMSYGAGYTAVAKMDDVTVIDPRPFAVGTLAAVFERYPQIGRVLPAVGYSAEQIRDLEATIDRSDADVVLVATPIDLRRVAHFTKPAVRAYYELREVSELTLAHVIGRFVAERPR
jgi:predicted GTPase